MHPNNLRCSTDPRAHFWKNQRQISQKTSLVQPQSNERLFQNAECVSWLQDLLRNYQQDKRLTMHYMYYEIGQDEEEYEKIVYKGYMGARCATKKNKLWIVGQLYIYYRIVRLNKEEIQSKYPYLLLFSIKCGSIQCKTCNVSHMCRIAQTSFYVIRTQFVYLLMNKLTFMNKFPKYQFEPSNHYSIKEAGETPYQYVKDHNYQPSYYFQKCQKVLVNSVKIEERKRGFDFQVARWDQVLGQEQKEIKGGMKMYKQHALYKLKYMCRKCPGKEIWTTRDKVIIEYYIMPLTEILFQTLKEKQQELECPKIFDECLNLVEKYPQSNSQEPSNPEEKPSLYTIYKTQKRRLDRSIKKQVQDYNNFEDEVKEVGRWHSKLDQYQWPYMVLFKVPIPKMACKRCKKEKDGLIYITNLIETAHSALNENLIQQIIKMHAKLSKKTEKQVE